METENHKSSVEQVREFHDLFQPGTAWGVPHILSEDRAALRYKLIKEELDELKEAIVKRDFIEILDALSDLQYVLDGTYVELGMAGIKDKAFRLVHESNMSKADTSWTQSQETLLHHRNKGEVCETRKYDGRYVCVREDGKILKSIYYRPVELASLIY